MEKLKLEIEFVFRTLSFFHWPSADLRAFRGGTLNGHALRVVQGDVISGRSRQGWG